MALLLLSCNHLETQATLSPGELAFIRSVGMLDQGETVHRFYSNFELRKAGSFFTDKRMAHYWLDGDDPRQHQRESAFYPDITAIDPVFKVPDFDCPYLQVRRKDQTTFRVYMDGSREEMQRFYQEALRAWNQHRHPTR
ncbi:hypothetical protein [Hymenobacter sp. DG25B]|uniref:hypothetical protein n=1 Tax=Hymenobacter sp. DG25B TaxID=1385664 RepID=UPI0012E05589|nr:hypothetical protein [Hymenobacter sp. DG25B]